MLTFQGLCNIFMNGDSMNEPNENIDDQGKKENEK